MPDRRSFQERLRLSADGTEKAKKGEESEKTDMRAKVKLFSLLLYSKGRLTGNDLNWLQH